MKTCDVCGSSLGLMNHFAYENGWICKSCYKIASRSFTETIKHKKLEEIIKLCEMDKIQTDDNFIITGRIGNYLLFDEVNQKICLANNRITQHGIKKPEIISLANVKRCHIATNPKFNKEHLMRMVNEKDEQVLQTLKVIIELSDHSKKELVLIEKGARAKSYAFRKSFELATRMEEKINGFIEIKNDFVS